MCVILGVKRGLLGALMLLCSCVWRNFLEKNGGIGVRLVVRCMHVFCVFIPNTVDFIRLLFLRYISASHVYVRWILDLN